MPLSSQVVTRALREAQRPLGVKELIRLAGLNPGQQTEVKRVLRELLRSGELIKDGKRFALPGRKPRPIAPAEVSGASARKPARPGGSRGERGGRKGPPERGARPGRPAGRGASARPLEVIVGTLSVHRDGFGFVRRTEGEGEDVFIPPQEVRKALDHDRVRVEVVPSDGGRTMGLIVEVLDRTRTQAVGTYQPRGELALVFPSDTSLPGPIRVPPTQLAAEGDLVKVQLGIGAELLGPGEGLFGEVTGSLGRPGDPSGEVLSIVFSHGFKDEFPHDVMAQSDHVPLKVSEAEARGEQRRDLRTMDLVTIDGADARDFDDAVYAEPLASGEGTRLVVAIADVTHYVREHTPLDVEAYTRGTSVYLPNRVMPMLPERLSAGICSLKPEEDRLCMVADMVFDRAGNPGEVELYPAVMRSAARCTYEEVQAVLDGQNVPHRNRFKPHFERLWELAQTLNRKRVARGSIDFDIAETKVVLGQDGLPVRMERRERKDSHRLIEECMLAANEAVAAHFQDQELPTIYRFHGSPDEDKLAKFASLASAHGFHLRAKNGEITSLQLADLIREIAGHPEQRVLNQLLLRSMMQAVYSSQNVGHYGLGAEHYLHFTSPIRRYPDLIVHRLLKKIWARGNHRPSERELERETEQLEETAVHSSEQERAAMQVEREVVAFYSTLLMKDRVGESFAATVGSVTDFGFFVELDLEHVEGLVKAETVGSGARFDALTNTLQFGGGRKVRVGDTLTVRLMGASLERRQLDFEVVAFEGEEPRETGRAGFERLRSRIPAAAGARGQGPRAQPRGFRRPAPSPAVVETARELPVEPAAPAPAFPPAEPVSEPGSPHPGFDRLRALAAKAQAGRSEEPPRRGQGGGPREGSGERGGPSGGRKGAKGQGSRGPKGRSKRR